MYKFQKLNLQLMMLHNIIFQIFLKAINSLKVIIIVITQMASKRTLKLIDTQKMLVSWSLRLADFFKHSILMQKQQVLIIGDTQTSFASKLNQQLSQKCKLSIVSESPKKQTVGINGGQYLSFESHNFKEIQQKLRGRKFSAIVVIPTVLKEEIQFQSQDIIKGMREDLFKELMKNLLAYRLAHRYLTKTGVIILSSSQKELRNYKLNKRNNDQDKETVVPKEYPRSIFRDLLNSQITHLGLVIGDRDYTNLHSFSVVAGSQEFAIQNLDLTVKYYEKWILKKSLPAAGSFALFRDKTANTKSQYVEYI